MPQKENNMKPGQPLFVVDAFVGEGCLGNPAAVCPLDTWPSDALMQALAHKLALSETAFFGPDGADEFLLRWFTPEVEADLCGHATLASAAVFFRAIDPGASAVRFRSLKAGELTVTSDGDLLELDFPSEPAEPAPITGIAEALGAEPAETLAIPGRASVAVFADERTVRGLKPDMEKVAALDGWKVIATAPGNASDFVSRCFVPRAGIPEDPVTGSAHTVLIPYWSRRLGKAKLHAFQVSESGGELFCEDRGDRVGIAGRAVIRESGHVDIGSAALRAELTPA
jgi:PhzF family phenazine biosynthesis protein